MSIILPSGNLVQLAIENGDLVRGFTHWTWWFSNRYVSYQRVSWSMSGPSQLFQTTTRYPGVYQPASEVKSITNPTPEREWITDVFLIWFCSWMLLNLPLKACHKESSPPSIPWVDHNMLGRSKWAFKLWLAVMVSDGMTLHHFAHQKWPSRISLMELLAPAPIKKLLQSVVDELFFLSSLGLRILHVMWFITSFPLKKMAIWNGIIHYLQQHTATSTGQESLPAGAII